MCLQWIAKTFTGGEGGGGIGGDYSALSVSTAPPQDGGSLTFNNGTGVFTFRPADLDYNLLSNKPDDLGTPGDGEINVDYAG